MNWKTTRMLDRYGEALHVVSDGGLVSLDAAQLAVHLALSERLNGAGGADQSVDQRDYERLNGQIGRLNDWLAANAVDLYQEPDTDTAEAMIAAAKRLAADLASVRRGLAAALDERNFADWRCAEAEAERDGLRQQVAQLDADNTALIARCNQMERDLLALQQQRDELSIDNLHLQAQVDALTVHVAALEREVEELRQQAADGR